MEMLLSVAHGWAIRLAHLTISPSLLNQPKIRTSPSAHSTVAASSQSIPPHHQVPAHPALPKRESTLPPSAAIHHDSPEMEKPTSSPDAVRPHKSKKVAENPPAVEPITPPTSAES